MTKITNSTILAIALAVPVCTALYYLGNLVFDEISGGIAENLDLIVMFAISVLPLIAAAGLWRKREWARKAYLILLGAVLLGLVYLAFDWTAECVGLDRCFDFEFTTYFSVIVSVFSYALCLFLFAANTRTREECRRIGASSLE